MSASSLSGGAAPSSVSFAPKVSATTVTNPGAGSLAIEAGNAVSSLIVQRSAGAYVDVATPFAGVSQLVIAEPPFATYASGANETQSQFVFQCSNNAATTLDEGALFFQGYAGGAAQGKILRVPKPNSAGTSDNIMELIGAGQTGTATILSGASTVVVPNTLVTGSSMILVTLGQAAENATAIRFWVSSVANGVSFTISANANASVADVVVKYFIVKLNA